MIDPDYFEQYECTFTVTDLDGGASIIVLRETIIAPRLIHERQFLNLVQQAFVAKRHLEVKISRYVYVDGRDDPLELSVAYRNRQ